MPYVPEDLFNELEPESFRRQLIPPPGVSPNEVWFEGQRWAVPPGADHITFSQLVTDPAMLSAAAEQPVDWSIDTSITTVTIPATLVHYDPWLLLRDPPGIADLAGDYFDVRPDDFDPGEHKPFGTEDLMSMSEEEIDAYWDEQERQLDTATERTHNEEDLNHERPEFFGPGLCRLLADHNEAGGS